MDMDIGVDVPLHGPFPTLYMGGGIKALLLAPNNRVVGGSCFTIGPYSELLVGYIGWYLVDPRP